MSSQEWARGEWRAQNGWSETVARKSPLTLKAFWYLLEKSCKTTTYHKHLTKVMNHLPQIPNFGETLIVGHSHRVHPWETLDALLPLKWGKHCFDSGTNWTCLPSWTSSAKKRLTCKSQSCLPNVHGCLPDVYHGLSCRVWRGARGPPMVCMAGMKDLPGRRLTL